GNIRVFVRVRPAPDAPVKIVDVDTDTGDVMVPHNNTAHSFRFDKCFNEQTSQEEMFEEVSTFVVSALDGYNVSLFAYGQTGSGKTHTVMGGAGQEQWGIVPRAVQLILASVEEKASDGWSFEITASFVEIYNDSLRDLLCPSNTKIPNHKIKKNNQNATPTGRLDVTDLIEAPVKNPKDVTALMNTASENRTVAKTDMNERSSRSHMVFSLRITVWVQGLATACFGLRVDLAGSERLAKSKAEGQQLKEAQAINKSLSALSDVFVALSRKSAHIPYRNSKLTHFLQPCLSGEGKALVIANLSPIEDSAHESLCTLRFASMVHQSSQPLGPRPTPLDSRH
ncbi:P-loop containing nucleoside triphosphate hydrolase protein, partial [Baffinella frigidus]